VARRSADAELKSTNMPAPGSRRSRQEPGVENMLETCAGAFSRERPGHGRRPPGRDAGGSAYPSEVLTPRRRIWRRNGQTNSRIQRSKRCEIPDNNYTDTIVYPHFLPKVVRTSERRPRGANAPACPQDLGNGGEPSALPKSSDDGNRLRSPSRVKSGADSPNFPSGFRKPRPAWPAAAPWRHGSSRR